MDGHVGDQHQVSFVGNYRLEIVDRSVESFDLLDHRDRPRPFLHSERHCKFQLRCMQHVSRIRFRMANRSACQTKLIGSLGHHRVVEIRNENFISRFEPTLPRINLKLDSNFFEFQNDFAIFSRVK